ncbi:hypothetical protein BJG93_11945 [Paraburkholderia sprentiae WSM5005]|uniref:Uncharacterized protein n=1 Tax=Paraburkholderia sprentiae WSM5005 TaxID=754502 RepID=A0A1I9YI99_9BURK|nr:hypothetical protein [Paraburkholderia sprentiae]APA86032.2 hypothetical protein BJG93_11945 [Paraburkholderia sprentiae WSM5005]
MNKPTNKSCKPATSSASTVGMAIILFIYTVLIFSFSRDYVSRFVSGISAPHEVQWSQGNAHLKPGPPGFLYDRKNEKISYLGIVDDKTKSVLDELLAAPDDSSDAGAKANSTEVRQSYYEAIERLAQISNSRRACDIINLLLLGGMFGALGAQLRSLTAFVNHVSKGSLDLTTWWPYYVMRPMTGFLLGISVIAVVQAGLFAISGTIHDPTLGWISLATLAGFGDREFTEKLRHLVKTLFGESNEKPAAAPPSGDKAPVVSPSLPRTDAS